MDDIVYLNEVRERDKLDKVCDMYEQLTAGFADRAADYLAEYHADIWSDEKWSVIAQMIITAYLCQDAARIVTVLAMGQAGSKEEFDRLYETLLPNETEGRREI